MNKLLCYVLFIHDIRCHLRDASVQSYDGIVIELNGNGNKFECHSTLMLISFLACVELHLMTFSPFKSTREYSQPVEGKEGRKRKSKAVKAKHGVESVQSGNTEQVNIISVTYLL